MKHTTNKATRLQDELNKCEPGTRAYRTIQDFIRKIKNDERNDKIKQLKTN